MRLMDGCKVYAVTQPAWTTLSLMHSVGVLYFLYAFQKPYRSAGALRQKPGTPLFVYAFGV